MISAVVALVAGVGVSSASAATPDPKTIAECAGQTPPIVDAQTVLCLQILARIAAGDYSPRDMQVAAPSSVMAATGSSSPDIRTQQVSRWRPNPQAWIDAKARLASVGGAFTTDLLSQTGRWQPVITKGAAVARVAGLAGSDTLLTWVARDGVFYPVLEQLGIDNARETVENAYCNPYGNFATDWTASWVGADCARWRMDGQAMAAWVRDAYPLSSCYLGSCVSVKYAGSNSYFYRAHPVYAAMDGWTSSTTVVTTACATQTGSAAFQLVVTYSGGLVKTSSSGNTAPAICGHVGGTSYSFARAGTPPDQGASTQVRFLQNGVYAPSPEGSTSSGEIQPGTYTTKVRCLDGRLLEAMSQAASLASEDVTVMPAAVEGAADCQPVGVDLSADQVGTGVSSPISTSEVPTAVQDWMAAFPNCMDGSCLLELRKVIGGSMEMDCFDAPEQCVSWSTEVQASPDTYRCYYGGALVAISECNVYTRVFDRDKVQQGTGYADPSTGTGVTTSTGTAVTTNPGAALTSMSTPASDPSKPRQCFPSGWGAFNPFEWVLQPVKCALEWAFVPRESVLSSFRANVSGRFAQTSFGAVAGIVTAVNVPGVGDGCTGPPLSFKYGPIDETWYPFAACDAPMAGVAATIKLWLGFLISAGAVFAIIRYVTAIIGFIPYGGGGGSGGGRRGPKFEAVDD